MIYQILASQSLYIFADVKKNKGKKKQVTETLPPKITMVNSYADVNAEDAVTSASPASSAAAAAAGAGDMTEIFRLLELKRQELLQQQVQEHHSDDEESTDVAQLKANPVLVKHAARKGIIHTGILYRGQQVCNSWS